jgi:hypothetical protein
MDRRRALQLTTTILGGTIFGSEIFLSGCTTRSSGKELFSKADIALLDEIGETILPETDDSPGAKAARIGTFMSTIVTDCYSEEEQGIFINGIKKIKQLAAESLDSDFGDLPTLQKLRFLDELNREAREFSGEKPHFFSMMKQLTIWGYFSSEPGATMALRYNPIPGRYIGCYPYKSGDKAWAQ